MVEKQYAVEVQSDFLEKITRAKPVPALSELIWNAFDADAKLVDVSFEYNDLDTLDAIVVKDDGEGLPWSEAESLYLTGRLVEEVPIADRLRQVSAWTGGPWPVQGICARSRGGMEDRLPPRRQALDVHHPHVGDRHTSR
ncbi:ATP-binding protein [Burkholderia cepacia]|uniref:ATP-binding protein n=1 Tax=Burkholderia cepacia TaxID=292 RepID=UPI0018C623C5|nr:ATP-binding protein [Burkholderia cepacia]